MTERAVVPLLPSATEIVYALGVEPAAVSHECNYPPEASRRPRATGCAIAPDGTSTEINEQLAEHDDVYTLDRDRLRSVDPALIITQGVCDVCAVDSVLVEEVLADMELDPDVITTDPHSLDDVLDDVERIGAAIGRREEAASLVADLERRITRVERRARAAVEAEGCPRALVVDWMEPPMVAGHWIPEMIELAGGEYGLTATGRDGGPVAFGDIAEFDPSLLIISPCGFSIDQTLHCVDDLRGRDGWEELAAVQSDQVYVMDGNVLNCPSPRLVDALETIGSLLHPDGFDGDIASCEPWSKPHVALR